MQVSSTGTRSHAAGAACASRGLRPLRRPSRDAGRPVATTRATAQAEAQPAAGRDGSGRGKWEFDQVTQKASLDERFLFPDGGGEVQRLKTKAALPRPLALTGSMVSRSSDRKGRLSSFQVSIHPLPCDT